MNSLSPLLFVCPLLLGIVYLVESFFIPSNIPSGAVLCSFEVILSALAAFKLKKRIKTQEDTDMRLGLGLLAFFLGLLSVTDGAYMFLFYFLKLPRTATIAVSLCTIPYSIAFLSCTFAIALLSRSGRDFYTNWKTSILPLALSLPILIKLLRFLVPLLYNSYVENGISLYLVAKMFNTSTSFLLINTVLAVLLHTRDKHWSLFSVGIVSIVLVNWAIETQNLSGIPFTFGFFEFFWAAGIMLCMFSITLSKENCFELTPQQDFSLITHYRYIILIMVSIFLIITHFLYPINAVGIRLVTALTAAGCLASVILSQVLAEKIIRLVAEFGAAANKVSKKDSTEDKHSQLDPASIVEFPIELRENLREIISARLAQEIKVEKTAENERQKIRQEANEKLSKLATQFAHDIRSPIAALDTAVVNLATQPEDSSHLIRIVAKRIHDIANTLLNEESLVTPQPIWRDLETIVQEKELLFCQKKLKMRLIGDPEVDNWLAYFQPTELKRILSNLLNNSFEALIDSSGEIIISVSKIKKVNNKEYLCLLVSDTGVGIPPHIIPQLMQCGATFGKRKGKGLGLHHARQCIESWGGTIRIESKPGMGTAVTIQLRCDTVTETRASRPQLSLL